jgi:hypothetical protein
MYENPSPVCVYIVCSYGSSLCPGKYTGGLIQASHLIGFALPELL